MTDAGHLRIENRLAEAIISAPFSEAQGKIVFTVFRLSQGWQRQSVSLTLAQLAQFCGYRKASGGFREQLKELLDEGVLVLAAEGGGTASNGYGLQTDFERWGKFAQSDAKLGAIWGQRPDHSDQLPLQILTLEPAVQEEGGLPVHRQGASPYTGKGLARTQARVPHPTPVVAATSSAGKTVKDSERQLPPATARRGRGDAMQLLTAIEAMRESVSDGRGVVHECIRRERIRTELGADVEDALKLCGGIDRLLKGKPEYRGALIAQFTDALNHVRRQEATA